MCVSVVGVGGLVDSTSFPSDLVNKSCIGFVYRFCLMSKDGADFVSERAKRAAAIGIFADARKQ